MNYKKPEVKKLCLQPDTKHADNKRECSEWGCCVRALRYSL